MNRHPLTTTLTLLLVANQKKQHFGDAIYDILASIMQEYSEEFKADLYARLAENVLATDNMYIIERKVAHHLAQATAANPT